MYDEPLKRGLGSIFGNGLRIINIYFSRSWKTWFLLKYTSYRVLAGFFLSFELCAKILGGVFEFWGVKKGTQIKISKNSYLSGGLWEHLALFNSGSSHFCTLFAPEVAFCQNLVNYLFSWKIMSNCCIRRSHQSSCIYSQYSTLFPKTYMVANMETGLDICPVGNGGIARFICKIARV